MSPLSLKHDPLYKQIADILTERIATGEWEPGMVLPAEPKLAEELGVSPGTVRKALNQLGEKKLITRKQGFGTLVSSLDRQESLFRFFKLVTPERQPIIPEALDCYRQRRPATSEEAADFDLSQETGEILEIKRLRQLEGQTVMIDLVKLPLPRFEKLCDADIILPDTLYDYYEAECATTILKVDEQLTAIKAGQAEADLLSLPANSPLLSIDRTAYSFNNITVERRQSVINTAYISYLSELT